MKFHSSIFSFDTLQGNPLRLLYRPSVTIALVLYLLAELAVRTFVPQGHIPKGGFHNAELRQRVNQLETLQHVDLDLMVTGSSVATVNITPDAFDPQMQSHGFDGFTSFNAGIRGCNFSCIAPGLERLFLSRSVPGIILIILSPGDLDANNSVVVARSAKHVETLYQSTFWRNARNALSSLSWVYGFDAEIRTLLTTGAWEFDPSKVTLRGHVDMGSKPRKKHRWNYGIEVDGSITKAFYSLLERLTERGISVIVIPVVGDTSTRRDFKPSDRQNFNAVIENAVINDSVMVVRLDEKLPGDEHYIDNVHLKTTSSRTYSRHVADRLIEEGFPWNFDLAD